MIEHRYEGEILVVRCQVKRIDASVAVTFRAQMASMLEAGASRLVLNLAEVHFIDSSGLGALVSILKRLGPGGAMTLCGVQEPVMAMFRLTRMDKVFRIAQDEAQALARIAA